VRATGFALRLTGWLVAAGALVTFTGAAVAMDVWMPQTGEVNLEEAPGDNPEARLHHAYALVGAGEWKSGMKELRKLIDENPSAGWVGEARLMIGRALLSAGKFQKAFDLLDEVWSDHPDTDLANSARELQHMAAGRMAEKNLARGSKMYDRLIETAVDDAESATVLTRKADAAFSARRYLSAQDRYLAVLDLYPRSELAPYCWFRIAESHWEMAKWLALGLEDVTAAERAFSDFLDVYQEDGRAAEAGERLEEVRGRLARLNAEVVQFYVEAEERPWAAVNYLKHLEKDLPESPESEWAAQELERITRDLDSPLRGDSWQLPLPGVEKAAPEE